MPRVVLVAVLVAIFGAVAANFLLATEEPRGKNLSGGADLPDAADVSQAAATAATPAPPCPSCDQDENAWQAQTQVSPPVLLGKTAALIEAICGKLILGQLSHERRPAASLVKIATSLVVADQGRMNEEVDITLNGWDLSAEDDSSIMGLEAGMRMSVEELVWGLLLRSGNDAAVELARIHGGEDRFAGLMNAKANALGLQNTVFKNPHGLDADGAYSSTFDMTILGKALLANPLLATMVSTTDHPTTWSPQAMPNGNWLLYIYPETIGIKTGYTEDAGATIVAAATRDGRTLIASVFDSGDVFWDSMRLFRWAFDNTRNSC